jgi:DNA-binding response OmpR family regulator/curved DNA-binding protein CbpA
MAKILIADDDGNFRSTLAEVLGSAGYQAVECQSGDIALSTYEKMAEEGAPPAALLIDLLLPKIAGFDLAGKLNELGNTAPMILMSGIFKGSSHEEQAAELGAKGFFAKPFDNADLLSKIEALLGPGGAVVAEPDVEQRPMPEEGTLLENPVFHLLWRAEREAHSGVLEVFSQEGRGRVFVYRGGATMAQHWRGQMNVGFQLIRDGHLTPEMYQEAVDEACGEARGIHEIIKSKGWVREAEFKAAYKALVPRIISALAPVSGNFRWIATEEFGKLIPAASTRLWDCLLLGVREATPEQLVPHIEPRFPLRLAPGENWPRVRPELEKGCGSDSLARAINGRATISQLVAAARDETDKLMRMRQVFLLMNTQSVMASLEPMKVDMPAEPEPAAPAPKPVEETAAPAAAANNGPAEYDASLDDGIDFNAEETDARERIKMMSDMIEGKNLYEILGVQPGAEGGDIKKAYFTLAREYHTDSFSGMRLGAMQPVLDSLFSRIASAYDTLSNDGKRAEYDAGLQMEASGQSTDIGVLMEAERDFSKGRTLLERGEMTSAAKFFEKAVKANPGNIEWASHNLFASWYLRRTADEAISLIAQLEKLWKDNQSQMDILYFAGRLAFEIEDIKKARKYMKKTLNEQPNHQLAQRDLRQVMKKIDDVKAEQKKGQGLLGKLRR